LFCFYEVVFRCGAGGRVGGEEVGKRERGLEEGGMVSLFIVV